MNEDERGLPGAGCPTLRWSRAGLRHEGAWLGRRVERWVRQWP